MHQQVALFTGTRNYRVRHWLFMNFVQTIEVTNIGLNKLVSLPRSRLICSFIYLWGTLSPFIPVAKKAVVMLRINFLNYVIRGILMYPLCICLWWRKAVNIHYGLLNCRDHWSGGLDPESELKSWGLLEGGHSVLATAGAREGSCSAWSAFCIWSLETMLKPPNMFPAGSCVDQEHGFFSGPQLWR